MKHIILIITLITLQSALAFTQQEQSALSLHNQLRKLHAADALQWDETLAGYAKQHATRCQFKHSHGKYGENLAIGFPTTNAAIQAWYDENTDYNYNNGHFSMQTGHFTQLVWKSTTKLGCASVDCTGKNGLQGNFLVCEYSPHGNITNKDYFKTNVSPKSR